MDNINLSSPNRKTTVEVFRGRGDDTTPMITSSNY